MEASESKLVDRSDLEEDLGQVRTSEKVAKEMVRLLESELTRSENILDPCIGENVFFDALNDVFPENNLEKVGIEVDSKITPSETGDNTRVEFCNFFEFDEGNFDFLIMNPPYVRHEKLKDATVNSKKTIKKSLWRYNGYLDSTYNLYAYFLIKADLHLKEGGKMVAITYDSWINSKFGESLIQFLEKKFRIESIKHYEEDAFENAEVGATVIEAIKSSESSEFEYQKFENPSQEKPEVSRELKSLKQIKYAASDHDIKLEGDLFTELSRLNSGKIRRGISPKANKYFLLENKRFEDTIELVKDVKSIDNFEVNQESIKFLLDVESPSGEVANYIEEIKEKIVNQDRYKTLTSEIEEKEQWYKINKVDSGNFLFNYYIRNRIRFIHNPEKKLASNNFYILNIPENEALMAALLNSSFTRLGVLKEGRNQGSGLKKIQVYEFEDVPIINPDKLDKSEKSRLEQLGRKLLSDEFDSEKIIKEIDELLLSKYNNFTGQTVSLEELKKNLE